MHCDAKVIEELAESFTSEMHRIPERRQIGLI